jgi:hypothetical protein
MRRAARIDRNQSEIVEALRSLGASVAFLHMAHNGIPDLLVGYQGRNFLMEIKDGQKSPSARKLTPCQIEWHQGWLGQAAIVTSAQEAIALLNIGDKTGTNRLQKTGEGGASLDQIGIESASQSLGPGGVRSETTAQTPHKHTPKNRGGGGLIMIYV